MGWIAIKIFKLDREVCSFISVLGRVDWARKNDEFRPIPRSSGNFPGIFNLMRCVDTRKLSSIHLRVCLGLGYHFKMHSFQRMSHCVLETSDGVNVCN